MKMFELSNAGADKTGRSFDIFTRNGKFAGMICESYKRGCTVYFDSNATRGSKRVFPNVAAALDYIHARRVKKGWSV